MGKGGQQAQAPPPTITQVNPKQQITTPDVKIPPEFQPLIGPLVDASTSAAKNANQFAGIQTSNMFPSQGFGNINIPPAAAPNQGPLGLASGGGFSGSPKGAPSQPPPPSQLGNPPMTLASLFGAPQQQPPGVI